MSDIKFVSSEIKREYFEELKKRVRYNYQIADFYIDRYQAEGEEIPDYFVNDDGEIVYLNTADKIKEYLFFRRHTGKDLNEISRLKWLNKSKAIYNCCKFWDIEKYRKLKVKEVTRVNRCRDKFCGNCQKTMAEEREYRFSPQLDELRKSYEVFHLVMTVPNCNDEDFVNVIDKMFSKFGYLIRYFDGRKKIKGIDFLSYGYAGAVRSLEVTQNKDTKLFHPHFHCMVLLRKGLILDKTIVNPYSFDKYGKKENEFSALEILLQKIWYLLMNDERVNKNAIDELKLGYDVQMTNSDGYYHEAFKYACKGFFDEDDMFVYSSKTFWTLYEALHKRKLIQGYGLLYNFDECEDILSKEAEVRYWIMKRILNEIEKPVPQSEELNDIIERCSRWRYFSKNALRRSLECIRAELEAKAILAADKLDNFFDEN